MAIVEEVIIQGDSSGAEAAWRRAGDASNQASAKMSTHADRVAQAWRRLEQQRAQEAINEVRRMNEADELQKKIQKKFGETAAGMLLIGAALREVGRAADAALKMMADRLAPKNELGQALTATQHKFLAIKQAIDDTNLSKIEKIFAIAFSFADSGTAEALARMDAQDASVRARERDRSAEDALVQQQQAASGVGSTNLLASSGFYKKSADHDRQRADRGKKRREELARNPPELAMDAAVADFYKSQEYNQDRDSIVSKMDDRIAGMRAGIDETNLERQIKASNDMIRIDEERAAERERIAKQEAEAIAAQWETLASVGTGIAANMTAVDAMFAWADGQKPALDEIADGFLKSNGKMLVSRGIMDLLIGGARSLTGDPTGAALAAVGGIEIGAGTAMMAGSLAIPGKGNVGGGGGGRGGGSRDFSGGGGRRGRGSDGGGDSTVILNLNGVMTSKDAGREIEAAIAKSRRRYST
jgi:hypothetical protein